MINNLYADLKVLEYGRLRSKRHPSSSKTTLWSLQRDAMYYTETGCAQSAKKYGYNLTGPAKPGKMRRLSVRLFSSDRQIVLVVRDRNLPTYREILWLLP